MEVGEERDARIDEGCRKAGRLEVRREKEVETDALMLLAEASMLLATSLGEAGRAGMRALIREGVVVRALERSVSVLEVKRRRGVGQRDVLYFAVAMRVCL